MKVFILTEGGKGIGLGHVARCCSLYDSFMDRGITPIFIINGDSAVNQLVRNKNHKIFNWLKEKNRLFNIIRGADIAVIDSYLAPLSFYKKISGLVNTPAYLDDNKRLDYPRGIVINGSIYAEEIKYPRRKNASYLLGTQYTLLRKEFQSGVDKKIKDKINSVMVAFGGDDMRNMTPKILSFLNENYPELTKNAVIGAACSRSNVKSIESLKDRNVNLIYYPDARKMITVMENSDIAISAGGQMLYELAKTGVPTIGICIAKNQIDNLKGWKKAGFLEYAGRHDGKALFKNVRKSIKRLESAEVRRKSSESGTAAVRKAGSLRIANILCAELQRIKNTL